MTAKWSLLLLLSGILPVQPLEAQEVVGKRLFSDQLVISEPFVEDELTLPSVLHLSRQPAEHQRPRRLTNIGGEVKKRITPDLEFSLGGGVTHLAGDRRGSDVTGFDNLDVGVKYQFLRSERHEAVASLALLWEVGGTGRSATGAESFDTLSPAVLVGKGLGDLPGQLVFLTPLAVSGLLGLQIPVRDRPTVLTWGGVIEYSLPYLEAFGVRAGLPRPIDRFVPITEIDLHTDLAGSDAGRVRGTVNPGIVWVGEVLQIGVEAVVPLDARSGKDTGVRGFLRIPLDALFGPRAGAPLFGRDEPR